MSKVIQSRLTAVALAGSLALAIMAPAAEAGHKYRASHTCSASCSHRVVKHVRYRSSGPVVTEIRHSSAAPAVAFIGGVLLGALVTQAHAEPVHVATHVYWDPYCDVRFASLTACRAHFHRHRHPHVVRVIDAESGYWVDTIRWRGGGWSHCGYDD